MKAYFKESKGSMPDGPWFICYLEKDEDSLINLGQGMNKSAAKNELLRKLSKQIEYIEEQISIVDDLEEN